MTKNRSKIARITKNGIATLSLIMVQKWMERMEYGTTLYLEATKEFRFPYEWYRNLFLLIWTSTHISHNRLLVFTNPMMNICRSYTQQLIFHIAYKELEWKSSTSTMKHQKTHLKRRLMVFHKSLLRMACRRVF